MTGVLLSGLLALAVEAAVDPCALPPGDRAPDPNCGETLDGRAPPEPSAARKAGQVVLVVPRVATRAAFWPVVKTIDLLEYHHTIDWARAILTTDDGLVGVRPELHYSTSFTPTAGARLFDRRLAGAGSELMLRARTGGQAVMLAEVGLQAPSDVGLSLLMTYDRRDDRLFAGIGPRTSAELAVAGAGTARYASDNFAAALRWSRPLVPRLVASMHADVMRRDYRATGVDHGASVAEVFDESELPGFRSGLRVAHAGGGLALDLRERARDGGGARFAADANVARGVAGDPSRHVSLSAEAVAALGGNDRVFLVRARAAMVERLATAEIPFEELIVPSGQTDMRGFPTGRWRGDSGVVGTVEYRWYISAYLDASLFADVGTVAGPRFSGMAWDRWFPSVGLGFRTYKPQGAYWQARVQDGVQITYAPEVGFRVLLGISAL